MLDERKHALTVHHNQHDVMFIVVEPAWFLHPAAVLASIGLSDVENGQRDIPFIQSAQ